MKRIYTFGAGKAEGSKQDKNLLGGKGANLAEMTNIGLPVPPGFTIPTDVCGQYYDNNQSMPAGLMDEVKEAVKFVEGVQNKTFGGENPLLFSVRSGAAISMPGMMDSVLNLGLNDAAVEHLASVSGNRRFALDSYRRFLQMFGNIVMGMQHHDFSHLLDQYKLDNGVASDQDLTEADLTAIIDIYKRIIKEKTGGSFPQDPYDQLEATISAIFASWNNERAIYYRRVNSLTGVMGTAVNVQTMVFGNMGDSSGTGVAFTRNPATGEGGLFGEFLPNAQGEDVVAGLRTPQPISESQSDGTLQSMEKMWPELYTTLNDMCVTLEDHYLDMQDIEFTIENGEMYLLQTRNGKRTAKAMVKIAMDMLREQKIPKKTVIQRIDANKISELLLPTIAPGQTLDVITSGLAASPGVACGQVVFTSEKTREYAEQGKKTILVRLETSPEDIEGMNTAEGVITARGGMTSHAAVVARGMGIPCVSGCGSLHIDHSETFAVITTESGDITIREGDELTINGATGAVIRGGVETIPGDIDADLEEVLSIADEFRTMQVRTNADTERDAAKAIELGAEGIGLCRTEHMFFESDRINYVRSMILADDVEKRKRALSKLEVMQQEDFEAIFKVMDGKPVNVRLIDPPLHEFMPESKADILQVAQHLGVKVERIEQKIEELEERNPMLGLRGCRLGILFPEIIEMQSRALLSAAFVCKAAGVDVQLELMVPLVAHVNELKHQKALIEGAFAELKDSYNVQFPFQIGTMIELPRAALTADEIATVADYFSFGTNDLTQTTYGLSRDDSAKFMNVYLEKGYIDANPFVTIDTEGVGQLVGLACHKARQYKSDFKLGVCGEHGGDPASIRFFHDAGLNYVSCSPFRVPVARLAAAQAALR